MIDGLKEQIADKIIRQLLQLADYPKRACESFVDQFIELTGVEYINIYRFDTFVFHLLTKNSASFSITPDPLNQVLLNQQDILFWNFKEQHPISSISRKDTGIGVPLRIGNRLIGSLLLSEIPNQCNVEKLLCFLKKIVPVLSFIVRDLSSAEAQIKNYDEKNNIQSISNNIPHNGNCFQKEEIPRQVHQPIIETPVLTKVNITNKESQQQLKMILEGSNAGYWNWNLETGEIQISARFTEMLGYQHEEFNQFINSWKEIIHPNDRKKTLASIDDHLKGKTPRYKKENRFRCKNGEWKWIISRGKIVERNQEDKPIRMAGILSDNTDRKNAEKKIKNLNRTLFSHQPD